MTRDANSDQENTRDPDAAQIRRFRVEHTEYAEIEVDVPAMLEAWSTERSEFDGTDEEFVQHGLWMIGVKDLMWSGEFINVVESDEEDTISNA